jgi:hypothetical protein
LYLGAGVAGGGARCDGPDRGGQKDASCAALILSLAGVWLIVDRLLKGRILK